MRRIVSAMPVSLPWELVSLLVVGLARGAEGRLAVAFERGVEGVLAAYRPCVGEIGERIEPEQHQLLAAAGGAGRVRGAAARDDEECEDREKLLHRGILARGEASFRSSDCALSPSRP